MAENKARKPFIPYGLPKDIPPVEFRRLYRYSQRNRCVPTEWEFKTPVEADKLLDRGSWVSENEEWEREQIEMLRED